jgi:hypothetical protein
MAVHRTPHEVADIIEKFLDGTGGRWDWDDFTSMRIKDPALDAIRRKCTALYDEDPFPGKYCGPTGVETMRAFIASLRAQ